MFLKKSGKVNVIDNWELIKSIRESEKPRKKQKQSIIDKLFKRKGKN